MGKRVGKDKRTEKAHFQVQKARRGEHERRVGGFDRARRAFGSAGRLNARNARTAFDSPDHEEGAALRATRRARELHVAYLFDTVGTEGERERGRACRMAVKERARNQTSQTGRCMQEGEVAFALMPREVDQMLRQYSRAN